MGGGQTGRSRSHPARPDGPSHGRLFGARGHMIEVCRIPPRIVERDRMTQTLVAPTGAMLKVNRLFHYQQFNAHWLRTRLLEDKIWFSNPAAFNDPWDCRPFFYLPDWNEAEPQDRY